MGCWDLLPSLLQAGASDLQEPPSRPLLLMLRLVAPVPLAEVWRVSLLLALLIEDLAWLAKGSI